MKNSAHNNVALAKTDNRLLTQRLAEKRALRNPCDSVRIRAIPCEFVRIRAVSCEFVRTCANSCGFVRIRA